MNNYLFEVPYAKQVRMIIHTDCKNEADDQYAVAHQLMTPKMDVVGIIAGHFDRFGEFRFPNHGTTKASYDEILKVLDLMHLTEEYKDKVFMGAETALPDASTPIDCPGARAIIEEAMKEDERPLYIGLQGSITDNHNLIHFLLKYRYTDNWEREVRENYLPISVEEIMGKITGSGAGYRLTYFDHYILPFIARSVKRDFDIALKDYTHVKYIYELE